MTRTPQAIGGKRFIVLPSRRRAALADEVAAAHAALETHQLLMAAMPQPTAAAALAAGETQLGKPYCLAGCRCSPQCSCRDCSGEVIYGVNAAGLAFPCTSSFAIAAFCSDHGTIIPMEQAIHTPGAIGVRNPWGTPSVNGANGHVWYSRGNGKETVEEGGRRTGCYIGSVFDKSPHGELVIWALFPGLSYSTTFSQRDDTMIIQRIDGKGKPKQGNPAGRKPVIGVWDDGLSIGEWNGASTNGDIHVAGDPPNVRRWFPRDGAGHDALAGGHKWRGVAPHAQDDAYEAVRDDGATFTGQFS